MPIGKAGANKKSNAAMAEAGDKPEALLDRNESAKQLEERKAVEKYLLGQ